MGWFFTSEKKDKTEQPELRSAAPDGGTVPTKKAVIWAVGGGKGGAGKSLMASNLGILLAGAGKKVLLVDADFGAANLHTFIRTKKSKISLSSFLLAGDVSDLPHLISKTSIPNLDLISGANDSLDVADFEGEKIERLWRALLYVDHDYVLIDVGPGTSSSNLDLFLMADEGVLVTTPDPTSIENTYRFLKCLYSRRMRSIIASEEAVTLKGLLQDIMLDDGGPAPLTVFRIVAELKRIDPEQCNTLKALMGDKRISIILNQAKSPKDREIGPLMNRACLDYFGLEVGYLGCVYFADYVTKSIQKRKPLAYYYKRSDATKSIENCLTGLLEK